VEFRLEPHAGPQRGNPRDCDDNKELNKRVDKDLREIEKLAVALVDDPYVCRDNRGLPVSDRSSEYQTALMSEYRALCPAPVPAG
jgi:hypothetical protein